jgi:hypothetical protein
VFANRSIANAYRRAPISGISARGAATQAARLRKFLLPANPFANAKRHRVAAIRDSKGTTMRRTLIRYKAKPEAADRNAELVAAVFAELKAARPQGVRYLTLRLEDDSFVHLVETAAEDGSSPIPKLAAFQAFQSGIRERCAEPPVPRGVTIVGNYRMLSES